MTESPNILKNTPHTILLFKLGAIGDVVMAMPAMAAVKRLYPDARITLMVGERAAPLLQECPFIDDVWVVDERIFWNRRIFALSKLFREIRRRSYDAVFIMHWSRLFHIFFWMAGIPARVSFAREGTSFHLTHSVPFREGRQAPPTVNQYLSMVDSRYLTAAEVDSPPALFFNAAEVSRLDVLARRYGLDDSRRWIAIAPGGGNNPRASMPERRWPARQFAALMARMAERPEIKLILLGDSSERDLLTPWLTPSLHAQAVNLCGALSLRETALVIRKAGLFIGNDSGLMHIAGAVRTPTLTFFGPISPDGKAPNWLPHQVLYTNESCSPCYVQGTAPPCPYNLKCLNNISVDTAWQAVQTLLKVKD